MTQDDVLEALKESLAAALPARYVQRSLVDPSSEKNERLAAGVLCLVATGGGAFANWQGREGELGTINVTVVGYVKVADKSSPDTVERAEMAMLNDVLAWCQLVKPVPLDCVYPESWRTSKQLTHPVGWLALDLEVKNV